MGTRACFYTQNTWGNPILIIGELGGKGLPLCQCHCFLTALESSECSASITGVLTVNTFLLIELIINKQETPFTSFEYSLYYNHGLFGTILFFYVLRRLWSSLEKLNIIFKIFVPYNIWHIRNANMVCVAMFSCSSASFSRDEFLMTWL